MFLYRAVDPADFDRPETSAVLDTSRAGPELRGVVVPFDVHLGRALRALK